MNSKVKALLWILGFAAVITVSVILYNSLKSGFNSSNLTGISSNSQQAGSRSNSLGAGSQPDSGESRIAAPDFVVYDENGNEVMLSSFLGKPVVLNFWASWCYYCTEEMPLLQKSFERYGDDVQFIMINQTDGKRETKEKAAQVISDGGYTFPVLYDLQSQATSMYGAYSIPVTYFIDKQGYVVTGHKGMLDEASLEQYMAALL